MSGVTKLSCFAFLALALTPAMAGPDADGWGGKGWYVSSDSSAITTTRGVHPSILFDGPHLQQRDCTEVYDRLYSPIGACRYLAVKPAAYSTPRQERDSSP
jgi:hypothetical protein